jgi:hypothetical protein
MAASFEFMKLQQNIKNNSNDIQDFYKDLN